MHAPTSNALPLCASDSPMPLPLPPIGIYIWSTDSGHELTIQQYHFCSQWQITWWRQIKKEMVVGGGVNQRRECLRKDQSQLNSDRRTEWGYQLHTGIQGKSTSMEDMNRSVLCTQYIPFLCPISKSIPGWHLKSSIKVVYFVNVRGTPFDLYYVYSLSLSLHPSSLLLLPSYILLVVLVLTVTVMVTVMWCSR
jgi:hypothetical protein